MDSTVPGTPDPAETIDTGHPGLPASASWRNIVERFFRDISENRIKRDAFTSVAELELAIDLYIADHNVRPKPFVWTGGASDILAKITRATQAPQAHLDKYKTEWRATPGAGITVDNFWRRARPAEHHFWAGCTAEGAHSELATLGEK